MFLKKHFIKIASILLAAVTIAVFSGFAATAEKMLPQNPISSESKTELEPEIIYGENSGNKLSQGESGDSENSNGRGNSSGENSDSPNRNNLPDDIKNQDTKSEENKTPETEKEDNGENKPSVDYIIEDTGDGKQNGTVPGDKNGGGSGSGNGNSGDNSSGGGGTENGGELESDGPKIVTDLENRIVAKNEIENDIFDFYAYVEDGEYDHNLKVNIVNDNFPSGKWLSASGDDYSAKLSLGENYITIYLRKGSNVISEVQYTLNYQATKADGSNPAVGNSPPSIQTSLDGVTTPLKNRYYTFNVTAKTGSGQPIYSNHIEVTMDGSVVSMPTGSNGTYHYDLYFPDTGNDNDEYVVTVLAWDDEGNSAYVDYTVKFHGVKDGESIGTATIVIDATTVGLGIIDSYECQIVSGETAAASLLKMLEAKGYTATYDGSEKVGFYVRSLSKPGLASGAAVPDNLWEKILADGITTSSPSGGNSLGEFDFTMGSGWMYSINGTLYPGKGLSEYKLSDGDTLTLRFTLAYGKDIGGSTSGGGFGKLASYCGMWTDGGYTEFEHQYEETERFDPTPYEDGYVVYTCVLCESTYTEVLPSTGHEHNYVEIDAMEPTETEDGYIIYACTECGDCYTEVIPALGPSGGEGGDDGEEEEP